MPQSSTPPGSPDTAALVRAIMIKLGEETPITLGNVATGESVPLPPQVAALIRKVLVSLASGHEVTITETPNEMTPNEAADYLNVSRMYVMKLIQDGTLPCRMVGNHHRIPTPSLAAYKDQQQARSRAAMHDIYAIDREVGFVDGPPPAKSLFKKGSGRGE
jgi:excisionase family DNA binding protein